MGHIFVKKEKFKISRYEFNGVGVESVLYDNNEYIPLKLVTDYAGYFAKLSKASCKLKSNEAIAVYRNRIKITMIRVGCISNFLSAIRKSEKMQHVIATGEVIGRYKDEKKERIKRRRINREIQRENEELEGAIREFVKISRCKTMADSRERALIRRQGLKVKGIKFRYVKRMKGSKEPALSVKDYIPARFEGNINLAF